jgi:hypothetical protein
MPDRSKFGAWDVLILLLLIGGAVFAILHVGVR